MADTAQTMDAKLVERLGLKGGDTRVVWADHPVRFEDVSARPYILDATNVDYVMGVMALGLHMDLPALGPDFVKQEPLKSGWVFYWDGSAQAKYSGSGRSFALPLSFRK